MWGPQSFVTRFRRGGPGNCSSLSHTLGEPRIWRREGDRRTSRWKSGELPPGFSNFPACRVPRPLGDRLPGCGLGHMGTC